VTGKDLPADDPAALGEPADTYHFGLVRPSERELREERKFYDKQAVPP
jgi:hypothetical protein